MQDRGDLRELRPADVAGALREMGADGRRDLLASLPVALAAEVLAELEDDAASEALGAMDEEGVVDVLEALPSDDRARALRALDGERRERVLARLEPGERADMARLLAHEPDAAGGIMALEVPTVLESASVAEAREALREKVPDDENTSVLFVVDGLGTLVGRIHLLRLLVEPDHAIVQDVMERDPVWIAPDTDQERAAELATRYDLAAVPVVDERRRLLGVVTFDDLFDVIEEEEAEDLAYFAGTGTDETPLEKSTLRAVRGRLPWLLLGLVGGIANAFVMGRFEVAFRELVSLAFFVPVVLGLSGAVAIQTSSLVVRGLADGVMTTKSVPGVASRELRVALILGAALGVLLAASAYWLSGGAADLSLAMLAALVSVVTVAAMSGATVPIALDALGVDPAVAMGPLLTALNDVLALGLYLVVATALLS